jgi:hypothetical protein
MPLVVQLQELVPAMASTMLLHASPTSEWDLRTSANVGSQKDLHLDSMLQTEASSHAAAAEPVAARSSCKASSAAKLNAHMKVTKLVSTPLRLNSQHIGGGRLIGRCLRRGTRCHYLW